MNLKTAMRVQQITEKLLGPPDECTLNHFVKRLREFEVRYGRLPKIVRMSPEDATALAKESHLDQVKYPVEHFAFVIGRIYGVSITVESCRVPGYWEWVYE